LFDNKVVLLGIVVAIQVLLAFGLTQFVIVPRLGVQDGAAVAGTSAAEMEAAPDLGVLVGLEELIVTLQSDSKLPRYVRTTVNVEVADQETANLVVARLPQLRDTVIMILSAKTPAEIQRPEGKQSLRDELFRRLGEKLPPESLRNIYFSDLVIQ
jgi:flagellar FliL protein